MNHHSPSQATADTCVRALAGDMSCVGSYTEGENGRIVFVYSFVYMDGNIYTNPNVILCLNIYLVVGNTVHNESRYLPCHCCFPACVPSSEYSY